MDSGEPKRIQEGQYGLSRANTEFPMDLGRSIQTRMCILGGPLQRHTRYRM